MAWSANPAPSCCCPPSGEAYDRTVRVGGNIPDAKFLLAAYVNIRDILAYEKVVLPLKTLDVISAHLGKE